VILVFAGREGVEFAVVGSQLSEAAIGNRRAAQGEKSKLRADAMQLQPIVSYAGVFQPNPFDGRHTREMPQIIVGRRRIGWPLAHFGCVEERHAEVDGGAKHLIIAFVSMQPSLIAETSRPLFPSVLFCVEFSFEVTLILVPNRRRRHFSDI
jgi:hypothetical protein